MVTTEGSLIDYIHPGNQLGVLVEFDGVVENTDVAKDVAMQVAVKPIAVTQDEVDAFVEKELEEEEQLINEGKPVEIAEKAAKGKLRRFYEERVLLNQKLKDNGVNVKQYLEQNNTPISKAFYRIHQVKRLNSFLFNLGRFDYSQKQPFFGLLNQSTVHFGK